MQPDSKGKADRLIADWTKRRGEFQASVKKQAEAGETAWERTKVQLKSQWNGFAAQRNTYIDTIGKQVEQQQATFQHVTAAQAGAKRPTQSKTQRQSLLPSDAPTAVKQMMADASEARRQKLEHAGGESWTALSVALA